MVSKSGKIVCPQSKGANISRLCWKWYLASIAKTELAVGVVLNTL